ncbi:DNA internalization-related competence protein ComEC/Rec2 [Fodinibius sediminis]|uniref:Competence protein ComEC n=1 Tax=Fodinibius sediminis TaxID=1214077 RepID=A0A521ALK0_9BACT|nr:DNA internalization-related competence protein ComEC/Rec2 [Fodinibius sediminis]SMO35687.1 competence protein ComEC [Fodinibius sediminis]
MDAYQTYRFPFASYPAVRLVLLLATGIALDFYIDPDFWWWMVSFGGILILYLMSELVYERRLNPWTYYAAVGCYLWMLMLFGGLWHSVLDGNGRSVEAEVISAYSWQQLTFSGEVSGIRPSSTGKYHIDIVVDSTIFPSKLVWGREYNLRAVLDLREVRLPVPLELGDYLQVSAVVYPLEEPRNPHEFDYKEYLASREIYLQAGIKCIGAVRSSHRPSMWNMLRREVQSSVEHNFSRHAAPLAKALLLGDKNELSRETRLAFSRAGLSHIMAVSGLHVGFILAPFWVLLPLCWSIPHGEKMGLLIVTLLLFFYAGLTGFSASVTRASLTGGLLIYGRLFHKVRNSRNLTAVAALLILLFSPEDLFSIGFQLSFSAVYIILLVAPVISYGLPEWVKHRWYGTPVMVMVISLVVQMGLFPLLGYYFGEFSVAGPLANALVVPVLGIIVPLALILLPFSLVSPWLSRTLNIPVDYCFRLFDRLVKQISGWEGSWMQVQVEGGIQFVIWAMLIFFTAALPIAKLRWKVFSLILALLCVPQLHNLYLKLYPDTLVLTVFDVGQGDAVLVRTPAGKHFLIDSGPWKPGYTSAEYVILPYLKAEGIDHLDGLFLSHPHADHIGGTEELIRNLSVDTIYNSGSAYDSRLYHAYHELADKKRVPVRTLKAGNSVVLDAATRLLVYGPDGKASSVSNVNNRSLVFEVVYGSMEFLFTGDAESGQEQRLLKKYPDLINTDFLKVAHHGSRSSSTEDFLRATSPEVAVVSLGWRNPFRHPHQTAVQRLRRNTNELYFTSLEGAVKLVSDGREIWVDP